MFTHTDSFKIFYPIYLRAYSRKAVEKAKIIRAQNNYIEIDYLKNSLKTFAEKEYLFSEFFGDLSLTKEYIDDIKDNTSKVLEYINILNTRGSINKDSLDIIIEYYIRSITAKELKEELLSFSDIYFNYKFINHFENYISLMESIFEKNNEQLHFLQQLDFDDSYFQFCSLAPILKDDILKIKEDLLLLNSLPETKNQIKLFTKLLDGVLDDKIILYVAFQ